MYRNISCKDTHVVVQLAIYNLSIKKYTNISKTFYKVHSLICKYEHINLENYTENIRYKCYLFLTFN